ncbi:MULTISPECIES: GNAT family N-acetyltransferase [Rhizobium]|uniref:GNAT family N-acetyltransferase n=1 Tax=Rhizobium tropici TaxID=398 RepID=A0A6P1CED3_RHITR|nr:MULTISPECIES: GNAT family N-acetyltransferase [Rhizobium]AGB69572.1 acetyltransferase, GNAT family [Rhizobium tropici CIAT 899]MBB4244397.1 GNAT superfamily N-acetyltransferase [Rhizobium tropici]MBB5595659.1 GNAT superfamily N-acetyltransferase [Rhizobium tropici]MBB6494736.1 GNAT superfamily N-acetyltransferase [Rhizobium tropici]NEV13194.1 GNAT family N-acetyltransferase [Rhizobium tropici]
MSDIALRRLADGFDRWDVLLDLILSSFAYMNGRIIPPSSALALTSETLKAKALSEIAYAALDGEQPVGCIFCRPEVESLYVGKLAVLPAAQGKGIGKLLLRMAETTARELGLKSLRLETRIELVDNHATFAAWGFQKTAENRHAGFDRTTSIEMRKPIA